MRLFTAISLAPAAVEAVATIQATLANTLAVPRWTPLAQIHLTLQFLGEQPPERVAVIEQALRASTSGVVPFDLGLAGLGAFPDPRRARVLWAGLAGDLAALAALEAATHRGLEGAGLALESRRYRPHVTLARLPAPGLDVRAAIAATPLSSPPWRVTSLGLFESVLTPAGARHEAIATVDWAD